MRQLLLRVAAIVPMTAPLAVVGCGDMMAGAGQGGSPVAQGVYNASGGAVRLPGLSATPQVIPGLSNPREMSRAEIEQRCDAYSRTANSGAIANNAVLGIVNGLNPYGPPLGNPVAANRANWDQQLDYNTCITALTPGMAPPEMQQKLLQQMNLNQR